MTNLDILQQLLLAIRPCITSFLICLSVIAVTLAVLHIIRMNAWVNSRGFRIVSLFYGLDGYGAFEISCAYIELVFLIIYLVSFRELETINLLIYAVPGLFAVFNLKNFKGTATKLMLFGVEGLGLYLLNLLCVYLRDVYPYSWYVLIYVFGSILIALLGIYRFLHALEEISKLRNVKFE